jgi:hypothetical protein
MNNGNREMLVESSRKLRYLPFAGITLFRFNGYFSAFPPMAGKHPEDAANVVFCV